MYSRMAEFARVYGDLLLALLFLLFFLYMRVYINELIAMGRVRGFVTPTFWPTWILNAALLCSALLVGRLAYSLWRGQQTGQVGTPDAHEAVQPEAAKAQPGVQDGEGAHLLWWLGIPLLVFAFIYALRYLGFIPSAFLFGVLYSLYVRERNPLIVLGIPATTVALILLVFTRLLSVPLPRGAGVFHSFSLWFY